MPCLSSLFSLASALVLLLVAAAAVRAEVPENVYKTDLISYPAQWSFEIGKSSIILVSDEQLEALASDPDKVIDMSLTFDKYERSLKQVCEQAKAAGHRTLIIAFDHFFKQYRPGQDTPRKLMPDMDSYVGLIAKISRFAQGYGLGLELSLLSPLEIGKAYQRSTGEIGLWMHYRKGYRDPASGQFSVQLWQQMQWVNNKGPVPVEDAGVRVFAFDERPVWGTSYRVVDPKSIVEITSEAKVEKFSNVMTSGEYKARRIRVHGKGAAAGGRQRVLVVQMYRSPEMDYFSPKALPFLKGLVDKYADAGVKLNALYSDEMHIQQDWGYFNHHDNGEFAMRYVSPGIAREYAKRFGAEFEDFARYLVYFCYGQDDFTNDIFAKADVQHVMGDQPIDIHRTMLFRARYYELLQDGVVDLFTSAKRHAEERFGQKLEARAHATWAESPTIDYWDAGQTNHNRARYEYTPDFLWSNTVQQSAAACSDYFKWGDFLTGNGNDHAEGGWLDRDYFGLALGCSTGAINEVPYSYAAHWGMPGEISRRRSWVAAAYGTTAGEFGLVQGTVHREVDVLMLYPLDLVAVEERFGSWMTQYGYANYITAAKLLELGRVKEGAVEIAGRRYHTLVTQFEPFPSAKLLSLMRELAESGGRVVWAGPPPILSREGTDIQSQWRDLFGVEHHYGQDFGTRAPGRIVTFEGSLAGLEPMTVLTAFAVDRVYPVTLRETARAVASCAGRVIGAERSLGKGKAVFIGCRMRDDQSRSLGHDVSTLSQALARLGVYPGVSGKYDNTEMVSRSGDYIVCRFPNEAVTIARHLRLLEEDWEGGFARNHERDAEYLKQNPPPSEQISLKDFSVNGHTVTYEGTGAVAFRVDAAGNLIGFAGYGTAGITVDGREFKFADAPLPQIAFGPVPEERRVPGGAVAMLICGSPGPVRVPSAAVPAELKLVTEGPLPGTRGQAVQSSGEGEATIVTGLTPGRWAYAAPASP